MTNSTKNQLTVTATPATEKPTSLMRKLCKHWSHKLEVRFDEETGEITFPTGYCELDARQPAVLAIRVSAPDLETVQRLQDVVASHLQRFAVNETLVIEWATPTLSD